MKDYMGEYLAKLFVTLAVFGVIAVVYVVLTTIRVDDQICWTGKVVQWQDEAGTRCASKEEAEWLSICPGERIVRTLVGVGCEKKPE